MSDQDSRQLDPSVKQEGRWEKEEHHRFLVALMRLGKDWRRVEEQVITRTSQQVRSHSQKFFIKLHKISRNKRKYKNRGNLCETETEKKILQLFKPEDITPQTPIEMAAIIRNQVIPTNTKKKNDYEKSQQQELKIPLRRRKSDNKLRQALQKITQEDNLDEDSYMIRVVKENKEYFLNGNEFLGLVDFGKHMENSADTDVRGRMSFGTPDDDGDSRRSMNDERTSNFNGVRDIRNTTNELEQRLNQAEDNTPKMDYIKGVSEQ